VTDAPPRRAASKATETRLLVAARRVFLDRGYEATTVRNIAKEASVTIGAFYGHFDSKRTVLFEVVRAMNVPGPRRRAPFGSNEERSLLLTVASFAHSDDEAAVVLGEVLRGPDPTSCTLDPQRAGDMLVKLAR